MTIDAWLKAAMADAEHRGLPEMKSILETLARATAALRAADFNDRADVGAIPAGHGATSSVPAESAAGRSAERPGPAKS